MYIKLSYDQEFDDLYMHLRAKYPKELFDLDGIGKQLDMHQFAREYYNGTHKAAADVSIDANANVVQRDVITYNFEMPKPFHKLNSYYLLWKEMKEKWGLDEANAVIEAQLKGDIYINDAWDVGRPYCFNFSTFDIALQGLPMGDRVKPVPPKSLYAFVRQVEQFTVYAANSTLGATGLADLFIVMAWYVDRIYERGRDHKLTIGGFGTGWEESEYVKEVIASLIYTLNWQFRGNQSPFTNVSLYDRKFLEELVPHYRFPDGSAPQIETVELLQRIYMEVMNEELARAPITFPVTTACFSVDEKGDIQDEAFAKSIAKQNVQYGFINIYCGKTSTLSSCCRLRSEADGEYFNSFGAGSTKIGSLGVVTLNLPRLAERAKADREAFMVGLAGLVSIAACINDAKRTVIRKRVERGNLPLYTMGHMALAKQYSTCGLTGINEAVELLGFDILTGDGQALVLEMLRVVNNINTRWSKTFNAPHNCEQVPAESSSVKLADKDRLMGFECGSRWPFYSNQFIPLTTEANLLDRIRLQGLFDEHFSGGAICHLNVTERVAPERIVDLIKACACQGVVYWAINYALNRCDQGHITVGMADQPCPRCGSKITDTFTRVVGFLTNTKNWNKTRRSSDWPYRQFYKDG